MSNIQRIKDLEINEDFAYQERAWVVQRVGWGVLGLLILAGLLGLLGSGWFSNAKAGEQTDRLWLEYERFERFQSPARLRVHLGSSAGKDGFVRVWLKRSYLENVQLHQVTPQPESVEAGVDRLVYVFRDQKLHEPTAITFDMEPEQIGLQSGAVGLDEGQSLQFQQFVYP
jgi:hypothetical protein